MGAKLDENNVPDIIIKASAASGFSAGQLAAVQKLDIVSETLPLTVIDTNDAGVRTRLYVYSSFDDGVNRLDIEGRLPEAEGEILTERHGNETEAYETGDTITVFGLPYTVVGIVSNPMIFDRLGEPDMTGEGVLERIVYVSSAHFFADVPVTDLYVRLAGLGARDFFSEAYYEAVEACAATIASSLGDGFVFLTMQDNKSVVTTDMYCDKVSVITAVVPLFFILVAALVVMTTMTRLAEEERAMIGCLKSLGAGDGRIVFKYVFMVSVCCAVAAAAGFAVGLTVLPAAILPAFDTVFFMPEPAGTVHPFMGAVSAAVMIAVVITVTAVVTGNRLREQPAELLRTRAPKPGKRILLERAACIWNRLPFRYKSSLRNIFRYKKHLLMTVVSVAGSTTLAFAGFGLLSISEVIDGGSFAGFKDSLKPISLVITAFALLLCVFVIYNLTNMNIGERKREIATLAVLGYRKGEILSYIYREILIMAVAGAVVGIALGCILLHGVLRYLDFGALSDVGWYAYVASFALIICFTGITDLILSPKILGIDMTASLKAND